MIFTAQRTMWSQIDGAMVRITAHALERTMEYLFPLVARPHIILEQAFADGFVTRTGLRNDCALLRSSSLLGFGLVVKEEDGYPTIITILPDEFCEDWPFNELEPLLRVIERMMGEV